jgi:hypothetical protein
MCSINITQYVIWLILLGGVGLTSCHLPRETLTELNLALCTPTSITTNEGERKTRSTPESSASTSIKETDEPAWLPTLTPLSATQPAFAENDVQPWHDFVQGNSGCVNQAAPGRPIDVNLPDDTIIEPGQEFTKIWRLVNSGTCTWTPAYEVFWLWGEKMGAADAYPLARTVSPGEEIDISISFIAPSTPGEYQSNWKLRTPEGKVFGIGSGDGLYFYVRIVVAGNRETGETSEQSPIVDATSITPTPLVGEPTRLLPGDRIDLDTNQLNPSQSADVILTLSKPHLLVSFGGVYLSIFGENEPSQTNCLSAEPSKVAIDVNSLAEGTYLCYLTDQGRSGWIKIVRYWAFQIERYLI